MQCSDWERAQDADPVIKRMKILMKEQLLPELAEVKSLCQHWKLLEIIKRVVTRVMRDLTQQKIYARQPPCALSSSRGFTGMMLGTSGMLRSIRYSVSGSSGPTDRWSAQTGLSSSC